MLIDKFFPHGKETTLEHSPADPQRQGPGHEPI